MSNDERPTISNEDRWKVLAECGPSQAQLADTIIRLRAEAAYWESEYDDCSTRYEAARGVVEALESLWREKQRLGDWTRATVTVKELRAALAASLPQPTQPTEPTACDGCGALPLRVHAATCPYQPAKCEHGLTLAHHWTWGDQRFDCPGPVAASLPVPTEPPTDREIIDSLIGKTPNAAVDQLVNRIAGVPTVPTEPKEDHR